MFTVLYDKALQVLRNLVGSCVEDVATFLKEINLFHQLQTDVIVYICTLYCVQNCEPAVMMTSFLQLCL